VSRRRPRFFISQSAITGDRAELSGAERHHLRVRRLRPGDHVELVDDRGHGYEAVVETLAIDRAEVRLVETPVQTRESPLDLTLAVASLKADKLDLIVEKATELGVTRIVVFTCTRSLGVAGERRMGRWRRIAVSAAKQCGRSAVPAIEGPATLSATAARAADVRLLCWEGAAPGSAFPQPSRGVSSVLVVVGPEGGFTDDEVAHLQSSGFDVVSLGPRIVRAETAAIAAVSLAQQRWGDLAPD